MRVVVSNVTCNWCEEAFEFEEDDTSSVDEALDKAGWFLVSHDGDETDFCSSECLATFFSSAA